MVLGVVRFVGDVEFAEGTWLGVELHAPKGKNDGSVQGKRYFTCKPNHGLLVRPSKIRMTSASANDAECGSAKEADSREESADTSLASEA